MEETLIEIILYLLVLTCLSVLLYYFNFINGRYKTLARQKGVPYNMKTMLNYFIFILPMVYTTVIISQICKCIVKIALKCQYGKKFKGFLKGQDPLYVEKHPRQTVVPIMFLVHADGNPEKFYESTKQYLYNCLCNLTNCDKFFGTIESFMGYPYIRSDSSRIDQYITKLRVVTKNTRRMAKSDLLLLVEEYYAHSLPKFNKALWQIFIGTQPVQWHPFQLHDVYPIIFKFSHCLFNEENFMKTLLGTFSDNKTLFRLAPTPTQKSSTVSLKFKMIWEFLKYSYNGLPLAIVNSDSLNFKRNVLVGAEMGTKKYFCTGNFLNEKGLLKKLRDFKNQLPFKTTFSCIFETAIMASLSEFYRKYSYSFPQTEQNLFYVTTIVENDKNFTDLNIYSMKYQKKGTCKNDVRFMCLNSPILELAELEKPKQLIMVLEYISSLKTFSQNFGEPEITRKISSGAYNYLPHFMQNLLLTHRIAPPAIVSSITGPDSRITLNGLKVDDIYGWCPNFGNTGIGFSICTYRRIPHVTLTADLNLIGSNADAEDLLNGVYKYVDVLLNYT